MKICYVVPAVRDVIKKNAVRKEEAEPGVPDRELQFNIIYLIGP
jgi:hypothetical protein